MSITGSPASPEEIAALAAEHGLELEAGSISLTEMGLDFRVAFARSSDGRDWVLRIPRRPAVMDQAGVEDRLLEVIGPRLGFQVPDWLIRSQRLIAYRLLDGEPGLVLDADGAPDWRVDVSAPAYAASLGDLLAQLHGIDPAAVADTGIAIRSPEQVRQSWADDLERVSARFRIAVALHDPWRRWLDDDELWPRRSALCHGEIYPGHTLVDDGRIVGLLDWTTASVGDPIQDLMFHHATASPEAFTLTLEHYRAGGGDPGPHLERRRAAMFSAAPLRYGSYALETGEDEHRRAAAALLDPQG
jgi:macrolide phosphotransferase